MLDRRVFLLQEKTGPYLCQSLSTNSKLPRFAGKQHQKTIAFWVCFNNKIRAKSDIDILVEFDPKTKTSFFELAAVEDELQESVPRLQNRFKNLPRAERLFQRRC